MSLLGAAIKVSCKTFGLILHSPMVTYGLIQYPSHPVKQDLEISRSMDLAQEVTECVLGRDTVFRFWDRIQDEHQKKLQAISDEYLSWVFEEDMIIGKVPCRWIILQRLRKI